MKQIQKKNDELEKLKQNEDIKENVNE